MLTITIIISILLVITSLKLFANNTLNKDSLVKATLSLCKSQDTSIRGVPTDWYDNAIRLARHESGNYRSKLARKYNNIFGMRHPAKRRTTSTKSNEYGYATYASIEDAVIDFHYWYCVSPRKKGEAWADYLGRRKWN